jgi:hypothetical protein
MRKISAVSGLALALCWVMASAASAAPTNHYYGTLVGTNFNFANTQETVQTADDDPNPLFEAPTAVGDELIFTPSSFDASSTNNSGIDTTHSTLNTTIVSTNVSAFIESIDIEEAGDIILTAFPPGGGTATTGVFATLSGTVTILAALNTSVIGEIVTFGGAGADFDTTFTPGPSTNFLYVSLPGAGPVSWTANVLIDLEALFPGAGITSAELQLNNFLQANSEPGMSSLIQKKTVDGPKITVIPEPGTAALLVCGLVGLALRSRRE